VALQQSKAAQQWHAGDGAPLRYAPRLMPNVSPLVVCKGVAHFSAKPSYSEYNSGIAIS